MRAIPWGLMALLTIGGTSLAADKVEVKVVKYAGLGEVIKQLKGKVVVVDFWADY